MAEVVLNLKELYPLQQAIVNHAARFKVVVLGRRSGKTEMAKDVLTINGLEVPLTYAYFAPTYKMLREVWDSLKTLCYPITAHINEQEKRLELVTGAKIDFWSLDSPDGARGRAYKGVIIDEAAMIPQLEYAWNEVIMPTLADYQGWAYFLSTPKGRNFFWQLYLKGIDPLQTDWMAWQNPTSVNPFIPASEIELARQSLPERSFKQEYEADFIDDAGAVFRNIGACFGKEEPTGGEYVFGVDWGRHNDYTVLTVMDRPSRRVVDIDRFNQIGWQLQRGRLRALAVKWQPSLIMAETNSIGEPNIEELQREGLPVQGFTTTAPSKADIVNDLALAFEQQDITIHDNLALGALLRGELESYELERLPSGTFRYNAPPGMHDDMVVSLMLAFRACNMGGTMRKVKLATRGRR